MLDALERARKEITYFALDLMHAELDRTLELVPDGTYQHVKCAGLWGTYDDGLAWMKRPENAGRPKAILSLGSSLGNFTPEEATDFIGQFTAELGYDDMMLVALDGCQEPEKVFHAYNDRGDVTHDFTMNGLKHANQIMGYDAFNISDWEAVGEFDQHGSRHRAHVVPKTDLTVEGVSIKKGEKVNIEESYKWPIEAAKKLWRAKTPQVIENAFYSNEEGSYCTWKSLRHAYAFTMFGIFLDLLTASITLQTSIFSGLIRIALTILSFTSSQ